MERVMKGIVLKDPLGESDWGRTSQPKGKVKVRRSLALK